MSEIKSGGFLALLLKFCPKCDQKHHQDYAFCDGMRRSIWDEEKRAVDDYDAAEDEYLPPMRFIEK